MKACWGVEAQLHAFFCLGTRWKCVAGSTTRPLYPRERAPFRTRGIVGWVGLKASLDAAVANRKKSLKLIKIQMHTTLEMALYI
jgi:hypothetical protein